MSYVEAVNGKVISRLVNLLSLRVREPGKELAMARRAEDFPLMISQYGLVPTLTFFLSKVKDEGSRALDEGFRYFRGDSLRLDADSPLVNDAAGGEGKGYASYLALVLVWPLGEAMKNVGVELTGGSQPNQRGGGLVEELLRHIDDIKAHQLELEMASMPGLLELKKILKALS